MLAVGAAAGGLRLYSWHQAGDILPLVLSGAGMLAGGALLALAVRALRARSAPLAPALVERKLAGPLFRASLRVTAIGPRGTERGRLPALARQVAEALAALDDPAGGGLRPGGRRRRLLLNAEEAAGALAPSDGGGGLRRGAAHALAPAPAPAGACAPGRPRRHDGPGRPRGGGAGPGLPP